jgi:hypothetical protein
VSRVEKSRFYDLIIARRVAGFEHGGNMAKRNDQCGGALTSEWTIRMESDRFACRFVKRIRQSAFDREIMLADHPARIARLVEDFERPFAIPFRKVGGLALYLSFPARRRGDVALGFTDRLRSLREWFGCIPAQDR